MFSIPNNAPPPHALCSIVFNRIQSNPIAKTFSCECGCGKSYASKQSQRPHLEPPPKDAHKCPRDGCGVSFRFGHQLKEHIDGKHDQKRLHECCELGCEQRFNTRSQLNEHTKTHARKRLRLALTIRMSVQRIRSALRLSGARQQR